MAKTVHRETWIDWAKAICIYLMVVGHSNVTERVFDFIYLFHMPVFFIISGILYHEKNWSSLIKGTVIPTIIFNLINYPYYIYKQITLFNNELTLDVLFYKPLLGFICHDYQYGWPVCVPFWFVLALFVDKLIVKFLSLFSKHIYKMTGHNVYRELIVITLVICVLFSFMWNGAPDNSFGFIPQRAIIALPFFVIGKRCFCFIKESRIIKNHRGAIALLGLSIFIYLSMNDVKIDLYGCKLFHPILYYICGVAGLIVIYCCFSKTKENNIITNMSKGTLVILGAHNLVLFTICKFVGEDYRFANDGILLSLIVIVVLYPVVFFVLKRQELHFIIGK